MKHLDANDVQIYVGDIVRDSHGTEFEIRTLLPYQIECIEQIGSVLPQPEETVYTYSSNEVTFVIKKARRIEILNNRLLAARNDASHCMAALRSRLLEKKHWESDLASAVSTILSTVREIESQLYALDPESSYLT